MRRARKIDLVWPMKDRQLSSMHMQKCSTCGLEKPACSYSGPRKQCTECRAAKTKAWRHDNQDKVRAAKRRYSAAHPERERDRSRRWNLANKDKVAAASRRWRLAHPDRARERHRRWRQAKPHMVLANQIKSRFGITLDDYKRRLTSQGGVCGICHKPPKSIRLAIDHDASTGVVRGLLCGNCNRGIGMLHHDPALLRAAAEYLEERKWERSA